MLRYAITDSRHTAQSLAARRAALFQQAARLASQGIDYLQLREKDLPPRDLLALARDLQQALPQHGRRTALLVNARADIALASGADGVHLTAAPGEFTTAQVRALYTAASLPTPAISISCHTLADLERLLAPTAADTPNHSPYPNHSPNALPDTSPSRNALPDLILFGPVFEKRVHGKLVASGIGLDQLAQACRLAAPTPVLALGGLTEANTPAALAAGAAGIAAIRLFV